MGKLADPVIERISKRDANSGDFAHLKIDVALKERVGRRPQLSFDLSEARGVARRALEIGYHRVLAFPTNAPGPISEDFIKLEDRAKSAIAALDGLIHHLCPDATTGPHLELSILTAQAGLQEGDPRALHERASHDGVILWEAREIAKRLEDAATRKDMRVRKGRKNDPKPKHREFAIPLAEMWVYLTGQTPGSNPDENKNPFLRFCAAGWIDVFGNATTSEKEPNFIGALQALKFDSEEVEKLKARGPDWL